MIHPLSFRRSALFVLYIVGFMFALRIALPSYINSSFVDGILIQENFGFIYKLLSFFIKEVTPEKLVGLIYMVSSFLTILAFIIVPKIIQKIGNYYTILSLVFINIFALIGLSILNNPHYLILFFIINAISASIIGFCLDYFVEYYSRDVETGRIRSFYLTATNIAWLFAPFAAARIAGEGDFQKVFFVSALIMSGVVLASVLILRNTKDSKYRHFNFKDTMKGIVKNKNISSIMITNFLLQIFYALMIIYMPIYLNQHLGFSFKEIGIAFTIMLLPFVFIQIPIGWIADKILGEKEFLITGFVVMAITTMSLSFITSTNFLVWGLMLFMTRVGAAIVEIMAETYFYKEITAGDSNLINIFKMTTSVAFVCATFATTVFLSCFDKGGVGFGMKYIWIILGLLMLLGVKYSLAIKDTK
jgi:MFS family permease